MCRSSRPLSCRVTVALPRTSRDGVLVMGILSWIIFGALAGWAANFIMGNGQRGGCLFNIVIGIVGAFVGGLIMQLITGHGVQFGFNLSSFLVAVLGAIVLLAITGRSRRPRS